MAGECRVVDHVRVDVSGLAALRTPAGGALLAEAVRRGVDDAALLATTDALRSAGHDPALVAAALTQARLRRRARAKFGPAADTMFFTADGLEQATRPAVADHRAARFAALGLDPVLDMCCGIGGDLRALGAAGARVHGVDRDPLAVAVAAANAALAGLGERVSVGCADVRTVDPTPYAGVGGCGASCGR